jgi:tetratricopeptide (TPR) repeat protein
VIAPSPKRLLDGGDDVARLLEQALNGYERGLDANRALARSRTRIATLPRGSWILASSVAAVALALLVARPWQSTTPTTELLVTAEPPVASPQRSQPLADRQHDLVAQPPKPKPARASPPVASGLEVEAKKPVTPAASSAVGGAEPAAAQAQEPSAAGEECLAHARAGDPKRAASCFMERANGSGLSAQVALYELSRLQRDALGDATSALASLDQYLERFPTGSLNGEARFSRLEVLARLGRTQEALSASSEFLRSRFGAERAPEVHLFRGNLLLRGAGSASQAATEYRAAVAAPGRVGDDAAYQLAVALDKAGATVEATGAYQQYLKRSGGRYRKAAAARLAELEP